MQKNLFLFFFFTFIIYTTQGFCQLAAQNDSTYFPIYDVFASADLSNGLRFGGRIQISEHFSFEAGYGQDLVNFIGPSDINYRYSIGINWHSSAESKLVVSFSYAQSFLTPNYASYSHNYYLSIGSLSLLYSRFHIFYSGGLWIKHNVNQNYTYFFPNLAFGIGWRIN